MTDDIDLLAATAYETGISPVDYAAEHVIQAHIDAYLAILGVRAAFEAEMGRTLSGRWETTAELSRRILADLLNAGCKLPEVTR